MDARNPSEYCEVRIIHPSQWPIVRHSRLEALRESPDAFLGSLNEEFLYQEDDWKKSFRDASWHVCFMSGKPVGIARSVILADYPDERYVESLWIAPDFRRLGLAREMLAQIVHEGLSEKRYYIRLAVLRRNQGGIAAFSHLGFSPAPGRSNDDEVCLEISINGQGATGQENLDGYSTSALGMNGPSIKRLTPEEHGHLLV